jgi:hypothetical protein
VFRRRWPIDLFLAYCYLDLVQASGLAETLAGRGLVVGDPLSLWLGQRLLPRLDQRLVDTRFALVLVSREFLALSLPRKELDGLTTRRRVLSVLAGVGEEEVAEQSTRLAVAALPWTERLVRLLRPHS